MSHPGPMKLSLPCKSSLRRSWSMSRIRKITMLHKKLEMEAVSLSGICRSKSVLILVSPGSILGLKVSAMVTMNQPSLITWDNSMFWLRRVLLHRNTSHGRGDLCGSFQIQILSRTFIHGH